MIFFHVALMVEGEPFIRFFSMKETCSFAGTKIFSSPDNSRVLILSGIGDFKATSSVSSVLSRYDVSDKTLFVNFGMAGARDKTLSIGELVRCVKSTRNEERSIFPDIIYETKNKYKFVHVETVTGPAKPKDVSSNVVVDNEAYGALFAANLYLPSENCFSFKVISDYSDDTYNKGLSKFDTSFVKKIIEDVSKNIIDESLYLESQIALKISDTSKKFSPNELLKIQDIESKYQITYAVKEIFENLMWRDKLLGFDIENRIDVFLKNFDVSCSFQKKRDTFNEMLEDLKI